MNSVTFANSRKTLKAENLAELIKSERESESNEERKRATRKTQVADFERKNFHLKLDLNEIQWKTRRKWLARESNDLWIIIIMARERESEGGRAVCIYFKLAIKCVWTWLIKANYDFFPRSSSHSGAKNHSNRALVVICCFLRARFDSCRFFLGLLPHKGRWSLIEWFTAV
jgi:hypothetical protein